MTMRVWGRGRKRNIIKENIIHIIQRTIPWRFHASVTSLGFSLATFFFMGRYSLKKYCICVSVCVSVFLLCTIYVLWVLWYCKVFAIFNVQSCQGTWWDGCRCALGDKWITIYTMSTMTPRSHRTLIKRFSRAVAGWFRPAFTRFLNPALSTDFPFFTSLVFESKQFALKDFLDFKTSSWPPVILVTAISYLYY